VMGFNLSGKLGAISVYSSAGLESFSPLDSHHFVLFNICCIINPHAGLLSGPTTHETRAPQAQAVFAYKASGYAALHADSS